MKKKQKIVKWNKEITLFFIEQFRSRPLLWDFKHVHHYNKKLKHKAWEEVAAAVKTTVEICKEKLTSLLASLRREKGKLVKSIKEDNGTDEVYKSSWFAYESLSFMLERTRNKAKLENKAIQSNMETCRPDRGDSFSNIPDLVEEEHPSDIINQLEIQSLCEAENSMVKSSLSKEASRKPSISVPTTEINDECTMYGYFIACKLKKYNIPVKNHVQYKISKILNCADRNVYNYLFEETEKCNNCVMDEQNICRKNDTTPAQCKLIKSRSESSLTQLLSELNGASYNCKPVERLSEYGGANKDADKFSGSNLASRGEESIAVSSNNKSVSPNFEVNQNHQSTLYVEAIQTTGSDNNTNCSNNNAYLPVRNNSEPERSYHVMNQISVPNSAVNFPTQEPQHVKEFNINASSDFQRCNQPNYSSAIPSLSSQQYVVASTSATLSENESDSTPNQPSNLLVSYDDYWYESNINRGLTYVCDNNATTASISNQEPIHITLLESTKESSIKPKSPTPGSSAGQFTYNNNYSRIESESCYNIPRNYFSSQENNLRIINASASAAVPTEDYMLKTPTLEANEEYNLYNQAEVVGGEFKLNEQQQNPLPNDREVSLVMRLRNVPETIRKPFYQRMSQLDK